MSQYGALAMKLDDAQLRLGTWPTPCQSTSPRLIGRADGMLLIDDDEVPLTIAGLRSVTFDLGPLQPCVEGS